MTLYLNRQDYDPQIVHLLCCHGYDVEELDGRNYYRIRNQVREVLRRKYAILFFISRCLAKHTEHKAH